MPEYMTTVEVAEMLRAAPETVRYWRFMGTGPRSFKAGRRVLYERDDVEQWISEQKARDERPEETKQAS